MAGTFNYRRLTVQFPGAIQAYHCTCFLKAIALHCIKRELVLVFFCAMMMFEGKVVPRTKQWRSARGHNITGQAKISSPRTASPTLIRKGGLAASPIRAQQRKKSVNQGSKRIVKSIISPLDKIASKRNLDIESLEDIFSVENEQSFENDTTIAKLLDPLKADLAPDESLSEFLSADDPIIQRRRTKRGNVQVQQWKSSFLEALDGEESALLARLERTSKETNSQERALCLLAAAYFYLEIKNNIDESGKHFHLLVKGVEDGQLHLDGSVKSAMYYYYAKLMVHRYLQLKDPLRLGMAEHVLKRQIESGEGSIAEMQLLLGDIWLSFRNDQSAASKSYENALHSNPQHPAALLRRIRLAVLGNEKSILPTDAV